MPEGEIGTGEDSVKMGRVHNYDGVVSGTSTDDIDLVVETSEGRDDDGTTGSMPAEEIDTIVYAGEGCDDDGTADGMHIDDV